MLSFIAKNSYLVDAIYGNDALHMRSSQEERLFLEIFPPDMQTDLHSLPAIDYLIEVTMNVGCYPLARYVTKYVTQQFSMQKKRPK